MKMLHVEQLEERCTPSSVSLFAGTLIFQGDDANNTLLAQVNPLDATQILTNADGQLRTFAAAAVQRIVMDGGAGADILSSMVSTVTTIMQGGAGNDNLASFGTTAADFLFGGPGRDRLYLITTQVGNYADGGPGVDEAIGNTLTTFINAPGDRANVVFDTTITVPILRAGVVLIPGTAGNDSVMLTAFGNVLNVTFNGVTTLFPRNQVDRIATILGPGDDAFRNFTEIDSVAYGTGGNDTLIGGSGNDLLKGGTGNDRLQGNAGNDDLSGDAGNDDLDAGAGINIYRVDLADMFRPRRRDRVVSITG